MIEPRLALSVCCRVGVSGAQRESLESSWLEVLSRAASRETVVYDTGG
jgi:hypothetical protein